MEEEFLSTWNELALLKVRLDWLVLLKLNFVNFNINLTILGWLPRRLGGGLGGTRRGGPDVNVKHSGREDNERERQRYLERERDRDRSDRREERRDDRREDRRDDRARERRKRSRR